MATLRVRADDLPTMAEVMLTVLTYARHNLEHFVFGPFDTASLQADGLHIAGDTDGVQVALQGLGLKGMTIEVQSPA